MTVSAMTVPRSLRRQAGFTLLDAMIAVVVLATGILALTLLQVTMMRATAEARERSVAATLAQNILEGRRSAGHQTSTGYEALATQGVFASGECDYDDAGALTPPNPTSDQKTDYRYCVDVQRFVASGTSFQEVATSGVGAPAYGGVNPEFKQIVVDIGWRRADGTWGELRLGDALSGIPLANSNDLSNRPLGGMVVQPPPQVRYDLTQLTQNTNFIPIAVGDGSGNQVAATNPTPKVIGGGVAETSFQVFTYSAANGLANVQRQVDTRVIGCKCTSRNAPSLTQPDQSTTTESFLTRPARPTFWDGARYVEPSLATYPTSDLIGSQDTAAIGEQSPLCDLCCRDHHDPDSLDYNGANDSDEADDLAKFDPYRTNHTHYRNPSADLDANKVLAATQNYGEVCRMIRVNGVYRVSQDPLLDHFAYIPTDNDAVTYVTTGASTGYQNFVQAYMDRRILPLAGYDWATNRVTVTSLEDTNGLNSQAESSIDIYKGDRRYLQNRSILLDLPSYSAKSFVQQCIDESGTGAPTDLACVLRHVSFASINLTELTRWSTERVTGTGDTITVTPQNFSTTTPTGSPVAGQVRDASGAVTNNVANAVASVNRSIATLADRLPIFFQDATSTFWPVNDKQGFRYVDTIRPSIKIEVTVSGLAYFDSRAGNSSAPYIGWFNSTAGTQGDCTRVPSTTKFSCDLFNATNASDVTIRMLNYHQNLAARNNAAECPATADHPRDREALPRCNLFRPTTFTGSTVVEFSPPVFRTQATSGKPRDDEAVADLGAVVDGGSYQVAFEAAASALEAAVTCDVETNQVVLSFNDQECRRVLP